MKNLVLPQHPQLQFDFQPEKQTDATPVDFSSKLCDVVKSAPVLVDSRAYIRTGTRKVLFVLFHCALKRL